MKFLIILLPALMSSMAVIAAETSPALAWQSAQTLTAPPSVSAPTAAATPAAQPATTSTGEAGAATETASQSHALLPPDAALPYARSVTTPLPPPAVSQLRSALDEVQRSAAIEPVTAVPRIRSLTVNLKPGASLPMVQVLPNYPGIMNFTDQTGAPWPIAAPPINGNPAGFQVNYLPDTPSMAIQARRPYDTGSVTVYLKGLTVPVVVSMTSGEPGNPQASQPTDSRLDLRIPQRGPAAQSMAAPRQKIGLCDNTLQAFLDGVPPKEAQVIKTHGGVSDIQAWQLGDDIYLRSRADLRDSFDSTLSSADGTHVWKIPATPYITFSVQGHNVPLTLELQ
ncbi:DotH/IcmK family type IV secretion protein [Photorhabdus sp. RM71S]|uniref:DotH/IcmK family type IV secretion protein n=1 Tax=Photorhabdus sp. RM71S TaxID=3342824 RepID=UPI0036D7744B